MVCLLAHPPLPMLFPRGWEVGWEGRLFLMIASAVVACLLSGGISVTCWSWAWHGGVETLKAPKPSAGGWAVSELCKLDHVFHTSLQLVARGHVPLMALQFGPCLCGVREACSPVSTLHDLIAGPTGRTRSIFISSGNWHSLSGLLSSVLATWAAYEAEGLRNWPNKMPASLSCRYPEMCWRSLKGCWEALGGKSSHF